MRKLAALVCALIAASTAAGVAVTATIVAAAINVTDRAAVIASYNTEFNRVEPAHQWNGNVSTCTPGTTSAEYQASILQRVNWYRDLAGLPPVTLDTTKTVYAQAGALISAAEGKLSHTPATTAKCYTADGYKGTSSSNIALGTSGVDAMKAYMDDYGANNTKVGHRAWILYPRLGSVATGDIPGSSAANSLYVFTDAVARVTPRDGAVAWPPSGYVPDAVVPARWSYHRYGADFTNAQVTVTGPSGAVATTVIDSAGFMDPGIVFEPKYTEPTTTADITYTVGITGITGTGPATVTYSITLVHTNRMPRFTGTSTIRQPVCSDVGTVIGTINFFDEDDGENLAYALGGADADRFSIDSGGDVSVAAALDLSRTRYQFTVTATDPAGASASHNIAYSFQSLNDIKVCPPIGITATETSKGLLVKWERPRAKPPSDGYMAQVTNGSGMCATTGTSCTITRLKAGRYKINVLSLHGSTAWSSITITARVTGTSAPVAPVVHKIKKGGRLTTAGLTKGLSGPKTYAVSGGCRLSSTKKWVIAPARRTTCTLTVRYKPATTTLTKRIKISVG